LKERRLLLAIALGVVVGAAYGLAAGPAATNVAWLGDAFLNALKMLVIPLVFFSMVDAVSGIAATGHLGRIGALSFGYYLFTTLAAVLVGLVVVNAIGPGRGLHIVEMGAAPMVESAGIAGLVNSIISPNLIAAAAEFRILPILVFALAFGAALAVVGEVANSAVQVFKGCNAAILKLVDWLMLAAPVGIAALIAARIGQAGGGAAFAAELAAVGAYCAAVIIGLAVHAFVTIPLLLRFTAGRSPLAYARNLGEALVTAFGTSSSSATLAVTLRLTEERNRVRPETANFVLPLGATINMDGTALYEAVAVLFIAQASGVELGFGQQALVALTATLASVGAAGIPQAGLVTMVIVLNAVGLPLDGIALILAVDWFLDRCRTTVNVWGDASAAAFVDAQMPGKLHL
jgi:Na+/H+-dicarboxylate symporter